MTQRPVDPDGPDDPRRHINAHDEALRPVARRGRGPTIAIALIVLAFLVGVLRPWDLLGSATTDGGPVPTAAAGDEGPLPDGSADPAASPSASTGPLTADAAAAEVCGYPQGWRSATMQRWAGRRAHVWTAVDVVEATGPADPAIPFQVVAGEDFTAIGWCAPVVGDERPPLSATGRLYRLDPAGTPTEIPYERIDPSVASALGELWAPAADGGSAAAPWPVGRYVIQLETASGDWQRWLGLDLRSEPVRPGDGTPAPGASGGPSPSASAAGAGAPATGAPAAPSASAAP